MEKIWLQAYLKKYRRSDISAAGASTVALQKNWKPTMKPEMTMDSKNNVEHESDL